MRSIPKGLPTGAVRLMLAGVLLFCAGPGMAQGEEEIAGARSTAVQGAKAFEQGNWAEAIDLFERAESLVHAPTHLLFMARAHIRLGNLVTARELYNKIIRENLPQNAPQAFMDAQESAREEIQQVEPRLARLTLSVQAPAGANPVVIMDGKEVPQALLGVPRPVDPGEHVVQVSAEGYLSVQQTTVLEEGGSDSLKLVLEPDPNAPPAALPAERTPLEPSPVAAPPVTPADSSAAATGNLAVPAYAALGVGAVGLAAGVFFTLQSASKRSDADDAFAECASRGVDGECKRADPLADEVATLDEDAGSARTLAVVGYAVGGLGLAAGITLLLLDGSDSSSPSASRVVPWVGYQSVGVAGTF